jgi:hypothetical protein
VAVFQARDGGDSSKNMTSEYVSSIFNRIDLSMMPYIAESC